MTVFLTEPQLRIMMISKEFIDELDPELLISNRSFKVVGDGLSVGIVCRLDEHTFHSKVTITAAESDPASVLEALSSIIDAMAASIVEVFHEELEI